MMSHQLFTSYLSKESIIPFITTYSWSKSYLDFRIMISVVNTLMSFRESSKYLYLGFSLSSLSKVLMDLSTKSELDPFINKAKQQLVSTGWKVKENLDNLVSSYEVLM